MKNNYKICSISDLNIKDINLPNQHFTIFGRVIPKFDRSKWSFSEELLDKPYEYQYLNDDIDYFEYINNQSKNVFFLYIKEQCAGQIRIRKNWNKYCFIEDICVGVEYRYRGYAKVLFEAAEVWAKKHGLKGFMLETQDFNLVACRMYHKYGFILGSVDNMLYFNTSNRGDIALIWYKVFTD